MKNYLREVRDDLHISREELERRSGVPARAIKAYESGQVELEKASYIAVIRLAKALEVEPKVFFPEDV